MRRCARSAGTSSGFSLLEVVLATAILGLAASTVLVVYVHCIRQATTAKDLTVATSVARNALEEGYALERKSAEAELPGRESLIIRYEAKPAGEELKADTVSATIGERGVEEAVITLSAKHAVYIQPEESGESGGTGEGGADE